MSLRLGRVAAVHPEDHSVDLVMIDDGSRLAGVQIVAQSASTNSGTHDLPDPSQPASGDKWSLTEPTDRDMMAVVGFVGRQPVIMGFLFPQVNQMLFKDRNRRFSRHASDVYTTVDSSGNTELFHPSGTYLRIGTSPAHEDLTGKDSDGGLAITKNTGAAVHVQLTVANGGAQKASINIDPSGNVTVTHQGNLSLHTVGNATVQVDGTAGVTSNGNMTLKAPNVAIQGAVNITGAVAITGSSLTHNGSNVGSTHVHPDPQGGVTGPPQ